MALWDTRNDIERCRTRHLVGIINIKRWHSSWPPFLARIGAPRGVRSFQGRRVQPFASQAVASQVTRTTPEMGHLSVCTRLVPSLASLARYRLSILSKDSQDEPI